ncbi:hypothetical protein JQX13_49220 [Archangium violaceum]|uniref:histidine kinase dimerization/phospho-acceptor domain-containing protein n=1 Tax=Archangium violaceum TaxID=83451 RepID=UPI00193C33C7|nr:histidine kinase dimerization/phospho-acceptor domain-containing protein [Archangium violaceum]QRK07872.1 hypothetical protein JQX13_49220 [Archangium violaceum]
MVPTPPTPSLPDVPERLRPVLSSVLEEEGASVPAPVRELLLEALHARLEALLQDERARELERRRQFVSKLSHALRNDLSAARMGAQMIVRCPENVERVVTMSGKILDGIERADRKIQELLDAHRPQG